MRAVYLSAAVAIVAGASGTAYAASALANGLEELPRHWWSSFPLASIAVGLILALLAWGVPRLAGREAGPS
jgi:hypothetical protein